MRAFRGGWYFLAAASAVWAQPYVISTVAGGAMPASPAAGIGTGIYEPGGLATDAAGNVYFASLNYVFRLGRDGMLTRVAGALAAGFSGDGALAVNAQLSNPYGVAVDGAGNLYIGDTGNNRIRRVAPSGIITTVAGTGTNGTSGDGGPATAAQIDLGSGAVMAADSAGNLYFGAFEGTRIRRISPTGAIGTYAGTGTAGVSGDGGPAVQAAIQDLEGMAVDAGGNLYIVDSIWVRKISSAGIITTIAGEGTYGVSGDGGPAINATFDFPESVAADASGNLYIGDDDKIRRITPDGIIHTVAGTGTAGYAGDGGPALAAQLHMPLSLATDGDGNLYIADEENYRVRMVSAAGTIATVAGNGSYDFQGDGVPAAAAPLSGTLGIAVDAAGSLYIADAGNNRVRKVLADGTIATVAGTGTAGYSGDGGLATAAQLSNPCGLAFDGAGNLYIADESNFVVRKVAPNGAISTVAANSSLGDFGTGGPAAIATDASGNLYVNTSLGQYVRKISPAGVVTQLLYGGPLMMGGPNFQWPSQYWGLAADAAGDLYAADGTYGRIIRMAPDGTVTTLAGATCCGFSGDGGPAAAAQLSQPHGLGLDGAGDLFIADENNGRIREISGGNIDTVAGNGAAGYSGDGGLATAAALRAPAGVAADASGRIYLADSGNHAIRLLQPQSQVGPVTIRGVNVVWGGTDIAQNAWIEIHGSGLAPGDVGSGGLRWDNAPEFASGRMPTQLDGVGVTVDGKPAFVFWISPTQVNVLTPLDAAVGPAPVVLTEGANASAAFAVNLKPLAPTFLVRGPTPYIVALHPDASPVGPVSLSTPGYPFAPAKPGEIVALYGTGFGLPTAPLASGSAVQFAPLPSLPAIRIGGLAATVQYAGVVSPGLYQFNVVVPPSAADGDLPVTATYDGVSAFGGAILAVQK
jgi:uncharacterized protein (TIGR03437 family)